MHHNRPHLFTLQVLLSGVGPLSASDVNLAVAAGAHIVMFNQQVGVCVGGGLTSVHAKP